MRLDNLKEMMKNEGFSLLESEDFEQIERKKTSKITELQGDELKERVKLEKLEIKAEFAEELEQFIHDEERKYNQEKRRIESEYDEKIYQLEQQQKKIYRDRREKLYETEDALKIRENEIDMEMQKLDEKVTERENELKKLNEEIYRKLGFKEYLNENNFIYRNKLEAVLILRKLKNKRIKILSRIEYDTVFKNVIGGVNELIKMNNLIIDYKKFLKGQETRKREKFN